MPNSEEKLYDDQIVIVDGLGITHFIPRRHPKEIREAEETKGSGAGAKRRRQRSR